MIIYHGVYVIKEGMRDEYVSALRESGVMGAFRKQPGNLYYNVSVAMTMRTRSSSPTGGKR